MAADFTNPLDITRIKEVTIDEGFKVDVFDGKVIQNPAVIEKDLNQSIQISNVENGINEPALVHAANTLSIEKINALAAHGLGIKKAEDLIAGTINKEHSLSSNMDLIQIK